MVSVAGVVSKIARLDHSAKGMAWVAAGSEPFFRTYGAGCAAGSGYIPVLAGSGVPRRGNQVSLQVLTGPGGAPGVIVLGAGQQSFPLTPTCVLQCLPLLNVVLPLTLGGTQPGGGRATLPLAIPAALATSTCSSRPG